MKKIVATICLSLSVSTLAFAAAPDKEKLDQRVEAAHAVLHELMATPDKSIPLDIASKATCVAVIPGFKKGAFLVGAQYGQGVATCRTATGWSAPVFIQISGASFGLQAGGQSTDLVLVGVNKHSMDDMLKEKVKLGGDIAAAAGPVGRDSEASSGVLANAEFLTYSRSKGLFAGVDLSGDEINQNVDDTTAYYGEKIGYKEVLSGSVATPPGAVHFVHTVRQLFRAGKMQAAK